MAEPSTIPSGWQAFADPTAASAYLLDAWQRLILTWDVLRERGNQTLARARSGKPPVLAFEYETVLDGCTLPSPSNYALVRVSPRACRRWRTPTPPASSSGLGSPSC